MHYIEKLKEACELLETHKLMKYVSTELRKWWNIHYAGSFNVEEQRDKYRQMTLEEAIENEKKDKNGKEKRT